MARLLTLTMALLFCLTQVVFASSNEHHRKIPKKIRENSVWIGKSDQATMCGVNKGISVDDMALELEQAEIRVYDQKKVHDNKMRIQMCGTDRGDHNGFLIHKDDLPKALELGFKVIMP